MPPKILQRQTREVFARQRGAKERPTTLWRIVNFNLGTSTVVPGERVIMVALWGVVAKVGKNSVDDVEGLKGLVHLRRYV